MSIRVDTGPMPPYDTIIDTHPQPEPRRHSRAGGYALAALAVAAGAAGWLYVANRPHPAQIIRQDIIGQIPLTGTVVVPPNARSDVYAPFTASVEKVDTSVGKHVERGDLLVTLQISNAEAYHEQTKQALKQAETAYANANSQLNAPVIAAQRQLAAARTTSGPTPDTANQQTAGDATSAQAALQEAIANRDSQLIAYKQQLDSAREANRQARAGERIGELRSPIAGTVMALNAQPGQAVGTDRKTPVATVVDLRAIQIQATADPDHATYIKQGTPILLSFKELPGKEFSGKVSNVTTRVESRAAGLIKNQQLVAIIDFKNKDADARPGMTPVVAIKTGEAKNALAAPVDAVDIDASGKPVLHVLRGGQWQDVAVSTGVSDGRMVQIKSGVKEGETVKVTPDVLHAGSLFGKR